MSILYIHRYPTLYPIWRHPYKGFPPFLPQAHTHPTPLPPSSPAPSAAAPARGGVGYGETLMGICPYWI